MLWPEEPRPSETQQTPPQPSARAVCSQLADNETGRQLDYILVEGLSGDSLQQLRRWAAGPASAVPAVQPSGRRGLKSWRRSHRPAIPPDTCYYGFLCSELFRFLQPSGAPEHRPLSARRAGARFVCRSTGKGSAGALLCKRLEK